MLILSKTHYLITRNKYHFDFEEFDEVSSEAKDFISRLLRQKSERRLSGERRLVRTALQLGGGLKKSLIMIYE